MNHKQRNGMKGTINLSNSRAGPGRGYLKTEFCGEMGSVQVKNAWLF